MTNLEKIRSWLIANNCDAILLPMKCSFDNYNSSDSDIKIMSGFSGSNGRAIISREQAILTVDGRYTFQAENETDNSWVIKQYPEFTINKMIQSVVSSNQTLAVATTAQTYKAFMEISNFCKSTGITVNAIDKHPVVDYRSTCVQNSKLIVTESQTIQSKIQKILKNTNNNEGVLIANKELISWILNLRRIPLAQDKSPVANAVAFFAHNERPIVFCDLPEDTSNFFDLYTFDDFPSVIKKFAHLNVIADFGSTPAAFIIKMQQMSINVNNTRINYQNCEHIKSIQEQNDMKIGVLETSKVFCSVLAHTENMVTNGQQVTEGDVVNMLHHDDAIDFSFHPISASGKNTSYCHYRHDIFGNTELENNALFLLDAGFHFKNSSTDMTRTIFIGENPPVEFKKCYTSILKSVICYSLSKFFDNTYAYVLDSFCRYYLWQCGYNYPFATGHGVGSFRSVHELPRIGASSTDKITAGMVTTVEPGYYTHDFGIRLENMLLSVRADDMVSFETLTFIPFCQKLIINEMLEHREIEWLNWYNNKIKEMFLPVFVNDKVVQEWIISNTQV